MNKKMREILADYRKAKTKEMRFPRHQRHRRLRRGAAPRLRPLKEQYELEEKCFKAEQSNVEEPSRRE